MHRSVVEPWSTDRARYFATIAEAVAVEAAARVRRTVGHDQVPRIKSSPTDVVTDADVEAESFIREQLARLAPGSGFEGEELDDSVGENGVSWVIDPIDGTVNFVFGVPMAAVSIGAAINNHIVAGAVVSIYQAETFSAAIGAGARLNGRPIQVRRDGDSLSQALIATGFSYNERLRARQGEMLSRLLPIVRDVRCFGSAALHLCWVANGRLDAYYESDLKYWDYAAGTLIATEAGARVEAPDVDGANLLIAARPDIFDDLSRSLL
ncbi:MAG: inositol monophosphatase family protein [Acidimicrobiia bacterium]